MKAVAVAAATTYNVCPCFGQEEEGRTGRQTAVLSEARRRWEKGRFFPKLWPWPGHTAATCNYPAPLQSPGAGTRDTPCPSYNKAINTPPYSTQPPPLCREQCVVTRCVVT